MIEIVSFLGWAAAGVGVSLGIPQLVRLLRTRDVHGISVPAWQALLAVNLGFGVHGILLGQWNMILTNVFALATTVPMLVLLARELHRPLWKLLTPGLLGAAALIGLDLTVGTAAFGWAIMIPGTVVNLGQSVALVRAHTVTGVSAIYMVMSMLNQVLWCSWGWLLPDMGTAISTTVYLVVVTFNLVWWGLRRLGLRAFFAIRPVSAPV